MASLDHTQLSALAAGVDDLAHRAAELAESLDQGPTAEAAVAMYEAERSLAMAARAVERARRTLDLR